MSRVMSALIAGIAMFMMSGCSSDTKSGPFAEVAELYAKMSDNVVEMNTKIAEINSVKGGISESAQKAVGKLMKSTIEKNEALSEKAKALAEAMQGMAVEAGASEASGLQIDGGTVQRVLTNKSAARIILSIPYSGVPAEELLPCFLLDKDNVVLSRSISRVTGDNISMTLLISGSNEKDAKYNRKVIAKLTKIMIVSRQEYDSGKIFTAAPKAEGEADETVVADGEMVDGPDTTMGDMAGEGDVATVNGVKIAAGMPLVETLKKVGANLNWAYNEDYGLSVTVGNVWILIPDEQVTKKGMEIIDNYDGFDDLQFSLDYISPKAKIEEMQIQ